MSKLCQLIVSGTYEEVATYLQQDDGSSLMDKDKLGQTALHIAVWSDEPEIVGLLLKYGADPTSKDVYGDTPIDMAVQNNLLDVETVFQDHGLLSDSPVFRP